MPPKKTQDAFFKSNKTRRSPIQDEFNCCSCDQPDSFEDMVQCDRCKSWSHFTCAGVDSSIQNQPWTCATCTTGKSTHLPISTKVVFASAGQDIIPIENISQTPVVNIALNTTSSSNINALTSDDIISLVRATTIDSNQNVTSSLMHETNSAVYTTSGVEPTANAIGPASTYDALTYTVDSVNACLPHASLNAPYDQSIFTSTNRVFVSSAFGGKTTYTTNVNPYPNETLPINSRLSYAAFPSSNVALSLASTINPISSSVQITSSSAMSSTQLPQNHMPASHATIKKSNVHGNTSKSLWSVSTRGSAKLKLELQMLEEENLLRAKRDQEELKLKETRDKEYLQRKYKLLRQLADNTSESEEDDASSSITKVKSWLNKNPNDNLASTTISYPPASNAQIPHMPKHVPPPQLKKSTLHHQCAWQPEQPSRPLNQPHNHAFPPPQQQHSFAILPSQQQQSFALPPPQQQQSFALPPPQQQQSFGIHNTHAPLPPQQQHSFDIYNSYRGNSSTQQMSGLPPFGLSNHHGLSKANIASRHLISRDLQSFAGSPDEWPLFISNFCRSTEICAFTDEENLVRLQKSLKGKALEAVRSLLIQPSCVPRVISTLKMLYGDPELVVHALTQKIQSTPAPKSEKLETLVNFALIVQNLCATIEASGLVAHLNNATILTHLVHKLPPTIRLDWARHKRGIPDCNLSHFSMWIYELAEAANSVLLPDIPSFTSEYKQQEKKNAKKGFLNVHDDYASPDVLQVIKSRCCICQGDCESVVDCKEFLKLNRTSKWAAVREHQLCRRCLQKHSNKYCASTTVCGKNGCTYKHNKLLHNDEQLTSKAGQILLHRQMYCSAHSNNSDLILFRVVPVVLYSRSNKIYTFAFLDDGSSLSLIDEDIARELKLKGTPRPLCLQWTGNTHRYEDNSEIISLQISGTAPKAERFTIADVHTVKKLQLPEQSVDFVRLQQQYKHLSGLPIESYERATPRLLIGLNNSKLSLPLRYREGNSNQPVATKTRLGWMVHGCFGAKPADMTCPYEFNGFHCCECDDSELQRLVKGFISSDTFGATNLEKTILSTEDQRALQLLNTYTIRRKGRFETCLLWKTDEIHMPDSLPMAKKRLSCLHKRMKREPHLAETLDNKIKEYVSKGYARKLSATELSVENQKAWYLPIFPVYNPNKPGKVRIVWDAAAKVQGVSLNSMLLKGPDQLTSLTSVIYKFRENPIAICADIMEMFHQVQIRNEDRSFQRFLWSKSDKQEPDVYVMNVMTFGATCSPCSSQFIKNKNADEFSQAFPRAARAIRENHYVDDLMDSVATEEEAIQLAKEVRFVHSQGGFKIRNWISNSTSVLKALNAEPTDSKDLNIDVELTTEKVLGMWWCTSVDCFTYKLSKSINNSELLFGVRRPTKRDVLRILMMIFDPLGLIAHFLMYVKVLLQDIWRSKVDWDEEIKDSEYTNWLKWVKFLPSMETLQIPRCYITHNPKSDFERQLHVFVDASENGFAAVAYLRNETIDGIECSLIGAKTRVAPLKNLSIPRLELQAAVLGARFAQSIEQSHNMSFSKIVFWSDSKTVLSWIRSDHRRYKQFVAVRVSELLDLTDISKWRWVPTKMNVADEATKWQKIPEFKITSRWFTGPQFLKLHQEHWPQETPINENDTEEELKTCFLNIHTSRENIFRYNENSNWIRLLRSTAFALRFTYNARSKKFKYERSVGPLSRKELQSAEVALLKEAQYSVYAEEIADLQANQLIERSSILYSLCPGLDENGVMRAVGRIQYAEGVDENMKRPIILPRDHRVTFLIIMQVHCKYHHQHHETVVNEVRQKFHILQLRAALAAVRRACQVCKNNRVKPLHPIMAQLPPARLASFCRPFSFVGVDYFGPMNVTIHRRTEKRWGVLLTCLTTRAVHLEVAHSLSSDSCILAIRNFIGRRGTPIEMYSDNGTNFVGAERELREALQNINQNKLIETFTSTSTKWKFIPPGSPHMGGSWERLVRSVKTTLYQVMPDRNPSDELLRSMLIEVENIVNSRPLTYIPIDSENEEALTPNHFLLGSSSGSKPLAIFDDDIRVLKNNWLISQQFAEHFWKRWVREYLPTITRRAKWFEPVKQIEVGDIVVITDPNSPRNCWPKGRVVLTKTSKDNQVRSAFVKTQSGVYERPVIKLAVLDLTNSQDVSPRKDLPGGSVGNAVQIVPEESSR
ncbi:uncharacterized protein LOC129911149 [Episyrphus balteatus]|uniref:uncharacterized protein LOC129911149 n=1 Tax=Episyrphus balteatus TaxID=286459 RepID=UPI0024851B4D|nr:uncharacterized protein LOC129911149 [Episyrphus balteatus]